MKTSALQQARAAYQPKLPKALQGAVKVQEGAPTQSVDNQEEIKALFPNTYGMPLVEFVPGETENAKQMNVGIILSGGQAPGGHNVISGLFDQVKKLNPNNKLYGFLMGPGGLVDHDYVEITEENRATFETLPEGVARQLSLDRDPHGNVQVSLIETEKLISDMVGAKLAQWKKEGKYNGKFSALHHFFGYEGRCAAPSNFDADYCYALGTSAALLIASGKTGYMAIVKNTTARTDEWKAGGVPITMMMNMERRNGEMKPVIRKALVELEGKPFKAFVAQRDQWAKETCYVYPGPIQYWGPAEVCDQPTKTLELEQEK